MQKIKLRGSTEEQIRLKIVTNHQHKIILSQELNDENKQKGVTEQSSHVKKKRECQNK